MPICVVRPDDGDVGHERQLEAAAQGEAVDLGDDDLRVAEEVVVEVERPAVDRQPAALARSAGSARALVVLDRPPFALSPYQA